MLSLEVRNLAEKLNKLSLEDKQWLLQQLIEQMNSNTTITDILEDVTENQSITATQKREWSPDFFSRTCGSWQGEPLVREPQPEYQEREPLL